jgi:hypothetical protein
MKEPTASSVPFPKLKGEPTGNCFNNLGADGVLRVYYSVYHPKAFEVIDAARLSPLQIKQFLDRFPFDQATEDRFRGVDGRNVPDEQLLNPPEEIRPERPSDEFVREHRRMVEERKRKELETGSKEVRQCGIRRSNHNLDPI